MTKSIRQRAEEYALKHVKHITEARLCHAIELLACYPNEYPEAETCDGCADDTIAVVQSYERGFRDALDTVRREIRPELRDMISRGYVVDLCDRLSSEREGGK